MALPREVRSIHSLILSQPQASSLHSVPSSRTQRICSASLAIYLTPNLLFLIALSYVPLPEGMPTHSVLASTLSRLTVIGIVILGALSGFGAIDTAWDFFPVFSRSAKYVSIRLCVPA